MDSVNVTIRVDKDVKKQAEALFSDLGLNLSSAMNMFLHQAIAEQAIPFKPARKQEIKFMDRNELDELSDKVYAQNEEAYKELAK